MQLSPVHATLISLQKSSLAQRFTMNRFLLFSLPLLSLSVATAQPSGSFKNAVENLPKSEEAVHLFNGENLSGWDGDPKYWSVVDGMIRGANDDRVPSSTYLFTKKEYRNFRLLLEVKQTVGEGYSTMHSAVCALGERFADKGVNQFGFKGPLLMFCHDWGIWDAYRRNRTVDRGPGPKVEKKGEWNLIEILVIGNRIRFVANGTEVFDFTDKPEMLQASAIGLQLHSNGQKQEYHFRGLVLTENPTDQLVTTKPVWRQSPEVQESVERGADQHSVEEKPEVAISNSAFSKGPNPHWIWGKNNNQNYVLTTTFESNGVKAARLKASCDNIGSVFVNGKKVAAGQEWSTPMEADVSGLINDGENVITAHVENAGGVAAFVLKLAMQGSDGKVSYVVSDQDWTIVSKNKTNGDKVSLRGKYGDGPWNRVFDNSAGPAGRVPQGVFETVPGFQVEKLFTVPKDKLGSWVCIAFDNKGRLLASDQGNKGICRITPPAPGTDGETVVEHLDFSNCEHKPSGAQGMLWAFDSLYFCCNGGPGSGLYRARDKDGDDQFDECVKLRAFSGGGEHGPHSLRLSPDGKRIFVIAGNHTDPPFKSDEDLTNSDYTSRVPTNWSEDLLLPRMWDANGHARGKLAPGGWIASTDADGKTWDIWSIGYRNPYDMAFNANGDLFAYDADMEWDVGAPWYRPTRVVHATSGSEFGWRSGTGKWPSYYIDSMPPLVNIGPGSPVGVDFGYGAPLADDSEAAQKAHARVPSGQDGYVYAPVKFPAKYQKALYICDWTFGTMYAIHIEPHQSSYVATKEEFVSRSPLPLTDCAAGPDGALYFSIGGRGTQSELFRVTYIGDESTEATKLTDDIDEENRKIRRFAESFHRADTTLGEIMAAAQNLKNEGVDLNSVPPEEDRAMIAAFRRALQNKSLGPLLVSSVKQKRPRLSLHVITAMARGAERIGVPLGAARGASLDGLKGMNFDSLTVEEKLEYVRALSLVFLRLGEALPEEESLFSDILSDAFPSGDRNLDRELCQLLVYLKSPTVVTKTVELMKQEPFREDIDMGDLLTRNAGYGRAINAMIANQPDKNQVWYAFCLRVAKTGWTAESRADYFRWFGKAQTWSGGNSFRKFLQNIENEAWAITSFDHRVLVEKLGARTPFKVPELPKPVGPGKAWTIDEVRQLAKESLKQRDFKNGHKMFAATRCILCHRFAGDGGATGPDLTQLAGRFNIDALTEAIMDPSKVISDQYKASSVLTVAGKQINGRIVSENEDQISVLTDPEDSTKVVDIKRDDIEEILPSKTSIMPGDLLKALNQDEVLDLLAFLLSRGDEKHPMFKK